MVGDPVKEVRGTLAELAGCGGGGPQEHAQAAMGEARALAVEPGGVLRANAQHHRFTDWDLGQRGDVEDQVQRPTGAGERADERS